MVAFELFGRPIYRYGIFYLITFTVGYFFLKRVPSSSYMQANRERYAGVYEILTKHLDDLFLIIILGVLLGGRLGHVFFYERGYYSQHLIEIFKFNQGGMSFVGGITGVVLGLTYLFRKHKLSREEFFLFGDIVLLIVPLGSLLGRIGNYLNQELVGKPLSEISPCLGGFLENSGLTTVYQNIDLIVRVNTNFIQSGLEGLLLLILGWGLFLFVYKKDTKPGLIVGVYFIGYAIVRYIVEYLKDLPSYEKYGTLSTSQILVILLFLCGILVLRLRNGKI